MKNNKQIKNPFIYGEEVSGEYFCDREEEIRELLRDIENSQNVIIFSPRRYGKTSLIKEVLRRAKGFLTFYIDLYPAITKQKFIEQYASGISRGLKAKKETILQIIKELIPRIIPKVVVTTKNEWKFEFDFDRLKPTGPILDDLLEAAHKQANKENKKAVVVFDEFQEIANYEDDEIERKMRSAFQTHHNVSYIFMGSKKHMMDNLFNNPNRPFYKTGKHFLLGKIKRDAFYTFIEHKFKSAKFDYSKETIEHILDITECHPYYTQMLCHFIWEEAENRKLTEETVELAIEKIFYSESSAYITTLDNLTQLQKRVLLSLAKDESATEIFSNEFIKKHNLSSPSSVQKAIKVLLEKEIIEKNNGKYIFIEVFFKRWLKEKF